MKPRPDDASSNVRRWLIGKIAQSRWSKKRDEPDEELAKRLGIQPDVLREARLVRAREDKKSEAQRQHRVIAPVTTDGKGARWHIFLEPPERVYEDFAAYRDRRRLNNSVLIRSVIHHVVRLTWQPAELAYKGRAVWRYHGEYLAQGDIRKHQWRMKCYLGEALFIALHERARNTGVRPSAIARWGVIALLEGKILELKIVSGFRGLYKRPEDYCLTPDIKELP